MSAKIYCIECLETGEKYIGSTIQKLSTRISKHKSDKDCSSKQIIERGKYKYYLLEEVDISQRYIREQYCMDITDNYINQHKAFTGLSEKEYKIQYNQLNKDKILQKNKAYNKLNKDIRKEYYKFKHSWGGDKRRNNNLLEIDLSLFSD